MLQPKYKHESYKQMIKAINLRPYIMLFALVGIWLLFSVLTDGVFLNSRNFTNLMRQTAIVGILSSGMVLIIVAGHIDLSIGSIVALTGGVMAIANVWWGLTTPIAILLALLTGVVLGILNGYLIAYQKIPAFIVTLGGMLIYRGMVKGLTKGETVGPLSDALQFGGSGYLPVWVSYVIMAIILLLLWMLFKSLRKNDSSVLKSVTISISLAAFFILFFVYLNNYKGLPIPVLVMILVAATIAFVATQMPFGRYVYAAGGNAEAAFYSGININRNLFFVYIIMGILAAAAGMLYTAQLGNATANAGRNLELDAIAACVIGGTSLLGGKGTIPGALLGALIMASLDNGMSLMNIEDFTQDIIKGLILVTAVWLDIKGGIDNK